MKRIIAMTICALFAVSALAQQAGARGQGQAQGQQRQGQAQGQGQGRMGGMRGQAEIFEKLKLTADQKKKIEALQTKNQAAFTKLRDEKDQAKRREGMQKLMTSMNTEIGKILTKGQKAQYDKLIAERRAQFQRGGAGAGRATGGAAGGAAKAGGGTAKAGGTTKTGGGGKGG
ncbi:MAG: hypothetical protein AMXMBFR81_22740 [Chthonomonas sp.]